MVIKKAPLVLEIENAAFSVTGSIQKMLLYQLNNHHREKDK